MLDVLYEDNHLLAVNKPAMLPTMGVAEDVPSLLTLAKDYVRRKYNKPGNVYLGIVSRLDAPVTGVVLLARTSKAASRLSRQFRERDVEKTYWAILEGRIKPSEGQLTDYIRKDERHRKMHIASERTPGAQQAQLEYRVLAHDKETRPSTGSPRLLVSLSPCPFPASLVDVRPLTGRKHQIRVQLSHAGFPILGDRKYGSTRQFPAGIALHSRRLVVEHPVSKMQLEFEAPLPTAWRGFVEVG
jgi:23S rRNA pseudouridine1911/1915/1917 synthase